MRSLREVAIYAYEHQAGVEHTDTKIKQNKEMGQHNSYVLPRASHVYCYLTTELYFVAVFYSSKTAESQMLPFKHADDDNNRCSELRYFNRIHMEP
jgi:hypothetical protein